ncbi:hypothetical protein [Moraxella catarrhalis]|nr:hypothetical protein [Moraxella catarrhalis]AIK00394.1 hypothetical protein DR90_1164 [Moraxella catarrhalis]ARB67574.1 hypothetical protein A6J52_06360 [Moraxella catarrhalis]ARE66057.1 hypothetical protein MC195_04680 [Moraxella catarrhalis]AVL51009.1 hypothetical protein CEP83_08510 [Moraxella catarrhalis]EGE19653.1 hypothetical protein E9S_06595 [Moraxella catarrhalis BC7]
MTTTTDRLDRLVNELFRKFEEMCKQRFEQETHKSQTDDTADWQQKYYQEQVAYYEKLAQERKEREKEWEEKSAALEREARWYPWVACSIILFAVVALIVKHFF